MATCVRPTEHEGEAERGGSASSSREKEKDEGGEVGRSMEAGRVASQWKEGNNAGRGREEQTRKRMRLAAARG